MNPDQNTQNEEISEEVTVDDASSVDDFIRELEAKEKDLHITADLKIEVSQADFDDQNIPDFIEKDLSAAGIKSIEPMVQETGGRNSQIGLDEEIMEMKDLISRMEEERSEIFAKSLRRLKDFEAFKRRVERERGDTFVNQVSNLATQMLPALDNLNRALDFALEMPEEKRMEIQQFFEGIVLVNQQVNEVFAGMGVQPIAPVGHAFDPHFHEAVAMEESEDFPPNTVSEEMLRGYRIGDKVIRHSMVKVTMSPKTKKATASSGPEVETELSSNELDKEPANSIVESNMEEPVSAPEQAE